MNWNTLAIASKNHEGSFATRLSVPVYWRQARLQQLFSAAMAFLSCSSFSQLH